MLALDGSSEAGGIADLLRRERVGGAFWGARPALSGRVLAPRGPDQEAKMRAAGAGASAIAAACDPWWIADCADEVWADADSELALVAALCGTPVRLFGEGRFAGCEHDADGVAERVVGSARYVSPFTGEDWTAAEAVHQLGVWRRLIDANRRLAAIHGVAGWKKVTLDALLWNGIGPVRYARTGEAPRGGAQVAAWKSRTAPRVLAALEQAGAEVAEIEDGFVRSAGLGANCVPPLSVVVDFGGIYFDPAPSSDLETLIETADIPQVLADRAAALRRQLVASAVSKYGQGGAPVTLGSGGKRTVLVTGQVEDDRSIVSGGAGITNLEVLSRARHLEGDAWIVYKPHPDVEAGHRKGHVPDAEALRFADAVERDAPITSLIDATEGLHVITSLAGFEALLRGKPVTTHGVPFYAGWGLTRDLGQVPPRRTRQRTLDELVAAALLLYPRYLDPVTRLPCPAEVVVDRLAKRQGRVTSPLVALREWQGRVQAMAKRVGGMR